MNRGSAFSEAQLGYYLFFACLFLLGVGLRTRFRWLTTFVSLVIMAALVAAFLDQSGAASAWYTRGRLTCEPPTTYPFLKQAERTRRFDGTPLSNQDLAYFIAGCRSDSSA